jgi:Zn-dependent protease
VPFEPVLLLLLPVFVLSIIVHECAHGLATLFSGDPTARDAGRITLNPLPHLQLWGSILVPLTLVLVHAPVVIGWARPIPIDPSKLRDLRNDAVRVALAGPAANLAIAVIAAGLASIAPVSGPFAPLREMAVSAVRLNVALVVFHLLPLPPLDGSWVLMRFLRLRHILMLHQVRWALAMIVATVIAVPPASHELVGRPLLAIAGRLLGLFGIAGSEGTL